MPVKHIGASSGQKRHHSGPGGSRPPPARPKREQVAAACVHCRAKKTKCDALRPCSTCASRHLVCRYDTAQGETMQQAARRKHDESNHQLATYEQLFAMLGSRDESDVAAIVQRIRSGHSAELIVQDAITGNGLPGLESAPHAFMINLAHSTGSLRQIARLSLAVSKASPYTWLPSPQDFHMLCNRIVQFSYLEEMLRTTRHVNSVPMLRFDSAGPSSLTSAHDSSPFQDALLQHDRSTPDVAPHWVPAAPWSTLLSDDDAVSHLISLFLVWINPTWRFVEADLFLKDMRSKSLCSQFCSPLLVNSILAIASLQSEHDAAFSEPSRDRISRGQHYHDKAMRLWALEEKRPTLTNIQALCVLALESNYRAKDTLGLTLVPIAAQLDNKIPIHPEAEFCTAHGVSLHDFLRARLNTYWMVNCTHVIMRIAFLGGATEESASLECPKIYDVFDHKSETWTGYPLTNSDVLHWPTLYLRERCRLAEIFRELHSLILTKGQPHESTVQGFVDAVEELLAKMQRWCQRLPWELQYRWPMSVAVWELHASYLSVRMICLTQARTRLQQEEISPNGQTPLIEQTEGESSLRMRKAHDHLRDAIPLAVQSAQFLQDFRECYGLKITPAWLLQLQAVAAGVLVLDPELVSPTTIASPTTIDPDPRIANSASAFEEVFRCLLGTGVEVMVARAIARMTYHTALKHNVALSGSTLSMLQVMSVTMWRPSDMRSVNSVFPNFATVKGHGDNESRMTELLTRWEDLKI